MKKLLSSTAAYRIFCADAAGGKLSHAYMLYYSDRFNLRQALKLFALKFFGAEEDGRDGRLILSEGLPDLKVYPLPEKKLTVETATQIVDDAILKPVEYDKKLYIIEGFESASPVFQNKLLKILEEPPRGVYFLLGATSLSSVLGTVKSRVKLLEIAPFTADEIYSALCRAGDNSLNYAAAEACCGVLGVAQNMLAGGWYGEVRAAAEEICKAADAGQAADVAVKYADCKYKNELIAEMQRVYFGELKKYTAGDYEGRLSQVAITYALATINKAFADIKFNANFGALLFDFTLKVAEKNRK